jgi:putative transposase
MLGLRIQSNLDEQHCGNVYRKLLGEHKTVHSQSRHGDCYDNAQAESL